MQFGVLLDGEFVGGVDASEVTTGYECGVMIAGYNDIKVGDVIETYEVIEEAATL